MTNARASQPLRRLMWLYLLLWVTEGALRKWIAPGLASPLLIVRDPVLLTMYFLAWRRGVFPMNFFVWFVTGLGIVALIVSVVFTDVPLAVELYGWRTNFLHLPLIFLIPVISTAATCGGLAYDARLRGPDGTAGFFAVRVASRFLAQRGGGRRPERHDRVRQRAYPAFGHFLVYERAERIQHFGHGVFSSGSFSRRNFFRAFSGWRRVARWWFLIALSGSRSVAGAAALIVATTVLIGLVQPRYWPATVKLVAVLGAVIFVVGSFAVFKQGMDVFAARLASRCCCWRGTTPISAAC